MEDHPGFLTEADIEFLTGYKLPSKQCEHLDKLRVPYHVDRSGYPRVLWSSLHAPRSRDVYVEPPTFGRLDALLGR